MAVDVGSAKGYLDLDISKFLAAWKTAEAEAITKSQSITQKVGKNFKSAGATIESAGKTLTKSATVPIVGVGAAVIKASSDFESAMSKVKAISGASGSDFTKLRNKAKDLGATTVFSATQVADGMTEMAKAGWSSQQIMAGMEGVLNAASASGEELASVSTIVADAITGFQLKAKDATRVADLLTQAANAGTIDISDLGESFKYIAPVASSMKLSIEDVTTAISAMSMAGIKGSQAGTSLRTVLARMAKPNKNVAATMKDLDLNITNADGSFKSLNEIVGIMRKSFSSLTDKQKAYYATALAGQEGMSGLLALLNLSSKEYDKISKSMNNANGVAKETSKVMLDNLKGKLTLLKSQLEGVCIQLGEVLIPIAKKVINKISELVTRFSQLSSAQQEQILKIAGIIAVMGPALIFFGKLLSSIGTIIKAFQLLNSAVALLVGASSPIGLLVLLVGSLTTAFGAMYAISQKSNQSLSESEKVMKKDIDATNKLVSENQGLQKSLKESEETRKNNITLAEEEGKKAEVLWKKIKKLSRVEDKSNAQKKMMKELVKQLNGILPDLNLKYDEETDKLNKSSKAIEKNIAARKKQALAEAMQTNAKEVIANISKLEVANEKLNKKKAEWEAKEEKWMTETEPALWKKVQKGRLSLGDYYDKVKDHQDTVAKETGKLNDEIDKNNKKLKQYNDDYDDYMNAAERLLNQVDASDKLEKLTKKAKKAGIEIPNAIKDGIESGKYAVPKSVAGIQNLIKYDGLIKKAEEAGIKVPKSLSDGIRDGSIKPKQAVEQINNLFSFDKIVKKAKIDGDKIPDSLASGIATGQYKIPKTVEELNNLISFNKLLTKAKRAGVKIPSEVSEGIQSGKYAVPKNVEKLQYLIKYDKMIKDAKKAGINVPKSITDGIKSKQLSPSLAVTQMNRYIDFNDAIKKAKLTGKKIPKDVEQGILSGKLSPAQAIKQMQQEEKKQLNKDNGEKAAGKKQTKKISEGINQGKGQVSNAAAGTMLKAKTAASSVSFTSVGVNAVKGIKAGVNDNKSGLFETIKSLASGMLSAITKALRIQSPSRVMKEKVGKNIALGIIVGVNSQKKNVKKNAEQLGNLYVQAAINKLTTLKGKNKLALDEEVKYWEEIKKHTKVGTSAYTKADKQITDIQKNYIKKAEFNLKDKKRIRKIDLVDEVKYWKNIRSNLKKGTTAYNQATKKIKESKKTLNNEVKKVNSDYQKNINKVKSQLKKDIKEVMAAYDDAVKSRGESIASSMGIFDLFESSTENTKDTLFKNLQSQVDALKNWSSALDNLRKRGVDKGLIEELQDLGPSSLSDVQLLVNMTDAELSRYVSLWKEKGKLAVDEAEKEIDKEEYINQIKDLINTANKELDKLERSYNKSLKKIGKSTHDTSKKVGKQIVAGLKKGIDSDFPAFLQHVKDLMNNITSTSKKALKIKSPSRVFASIGGFITQGLGNGLSMGMKKVNKQVEDEMNNLSNVDVGFETNKTISTVDRLRNIMSSLFAMFDNIDAKMLTSFENISNILKRVVSLYSQSIGVMMAGDGVGYIGYNYGSLPSVNLTNPSEVKTDKQVGDTFIFNSPKAIDEIEAAKQMKKAKRDLEEGF